MMVSISSATELKFGRTANGTPSWKGTRSGIRKSTAFNRRPQAGYASIFFPAWAMFIFANSRYSISAALASRDSLRPSPSRQIAVLEKGDFCRLPLIPLLPCNQINGFSTCPKRRQHSLKYAGTKPKLVVLYPYLATRLIPATLVWNPQLNPGG